MSEENKKGVTVLRQGGAAPRVRAAKSSEFGEGKLCEPWMDPFVAGAALH